MATDSQHVESLIKKFNLKFKNKTNERNKSVHDILANIAHSQICCSQTGSHSYFHVKWFHVMGMLRKLCAPKPLKNICFNKFLILIIPILESGPRDGYCLVRELVWCICNGCRVLVCGSLVPQWDLQWNSALQINFLKNFINFILTFGNRSDGIPILTEIVYSVVGLKSMISKMLLFIVLSSALMLGKN